MVGLVAMCPAPTCVRCHSVPSVTRLFSSGMQLRQPQWAPLSATRHRLLGACRMQPAIVAKAAAAPSAAPQAEATLRNQRGSPHKVRRVLDLIRGRTYEEALILLEYLPFRACDPVIDTLISAAANAKNNLGMRKAKLYVSECMADGGPVLKRIRPRAKGRGARILKPTFHLVVKVKERES